MLETLIFNISSALLEIFIGALRKYRFALALGKKSREADEQDRRRRRDEDLRSALKLIQTGLHIIRELPTFIRPKQNYIWSPLPEAGFDLMRAKDLIKELDGALLDSLMKISQKIQQTNFHIGAQLQDRSSATPDRDAQNAMLKLSDPALTAIDKCILKIKENLAQMELTELKSA
ncbi:hypothetical protein J7M28_10060 [bacterium]|nr:hypothetical protein [bacterium]